MPHALIVEEDPTARSALADLVARDGYTSELAANLAEARARVDPVPDLVLADLELPDGSGTELLSDPSIARHSDVVLIADEGRVAGAMGLGTFGTLAKPLDPRQLHGVLARVAQTSPRSARTSFGPLIGGSPSMQELYASIARVAPTDAAVLIAGESGTGKELVARTLHRMSPRAGGPYLAVDCAAVPPNLIAGELLGDESGSFTAKARRHQGLLERARGGTLFLDEVTAIPLDLQGRLLRVLETGTAGCTASGETIASDVRVVGATHRDPLEAVRSGRLRQDLLHRLQNATLYVPPLRHRPGDVALLTQHFLGRLNDDGGSEKAFSPAALARMERYRWPGNVRELCNVVRRTWIMCEGRTITQPTLRCKALPGSVAPATAFTVAVGESVAEVERRLILHTVRHCRTRDEAARILRISTKTLYNKLRLYEAGARPRNGSAGAAAQAPQPREGNARDTDIATQ